MRLPKRIVLTAMRTLEDVLAQAELGPVEPQWGHELALRLLQAAQIAQPWQCAAFREEMVAEYANAWHPNDALYLRTSTLTGALDNWWRRLGCQPPSNVQRGRWADAYSAEVDGICGTRQHPCMCNRYQPGDRQTVMNLFDAKLARAFNDGPATVHPKDPGPVIVKRDGALLLDQMTWGFPMAFTGKQGQKLKSRPVNNARFDKLGGYWKRWAADPAQRCLIPTARYAEAVGPKGYKTETWLSIKGEPMFAWAGLWRDSEEWGLSYTGVMTDAATELADIHDRAPVIVNRDDWETWLSAPLADLARFNRPLPTEWMEVEATSEPWVRKC